MSLSFLASLLLYSIDKIIEDSKMQILKYSVFMSQVVKLIRIIYIYIYIYVEFLDVNTTVF